MRLRFGFNTAGNLGNTGLQHTNAMIVSKHVMEGNVQWNYIWLYLDAVHRYLYGNTQVLTFMYKK